MTRLWGTQTLGQIRLVCPWRWLWMRWTFESADWAKHKALPNVSGPPPVSWKSDWSKKTDPSQERILRAVFKLGHCSWSFWGTPSEAGLFLGQEPEGLPSCSHAVSFPGSPAHWPSCRSWCSSISYNKPHPYYQWQWDTRQLSSPRGGAEPDRQATGTGSQPSRLFCLEFWEVPAMGAAAQLGPGAEGSRQGTRVKGVPGFSRLFREEDGFALPVFMTPNHQVRSQTPLVLSQHTAWHFPTSSCRPLGQCRLHGCFDVVRFLLGTKLRCVVSAVSGAPASATGHCSS